MNLYNNKLYNSNQNTKKENPLNNKYYFIHYTLIINIKKKLYL